MTPEAQRIAIATACGWKIIGILQTVAEGYIYDDLHGFRQKEEYASLIPDYLNDLNSMHEAEMTLMDGNHKAQLDAMDHWMECFTTDIQGYYFNWHATASQRAEAFLRAIGKWEDDK